MFAMTMALLLQAAPLTIDANSPRWEHSPGPDDYPRYHPEAARKVFLNGRAVLLCHVAADGALDGCRAEDVSPANGGFAETALRMRSLFKLPAPMRDGRPADDGWVRVPLTFKLLPDVTASPVPRSTPRSPASRSTSTADTRRQVWMTAAPTQLRTRPKRWRWHWRHR